MNRRAFLRTILGAAAATVAPTYFIPPVGGWKSDVIANPGETSLTTYIVGADAITVFDPPKLLNLYYNRKFIENLKANIPSVFDKVERLPENPQIVRFRFTPLDLRATNADRQNKNF